MARSRVCAGRAASAVLPCPQARPIARFAERRSACGPQVRPRAPAKILAPGPSCVSDTLLTQTVSCGPLRRSRREFITISQIHRSHTDIRVRVSPPQPRSRLKPEVRKRKTPSRGLRSASHSWPYACAGGPRPPVPPLLGGRSFTICPFYATPELLIGFAAAVACTIALRFMLQATYLTFCRPSL